MKRSEANEILCRRNSLFGQYHHISSIGIKFFSPQGCSVCRNGAADVTDCDVIPIQGVVMVSARLCDGCLCSWFSNDDSDLDCYVTDEDEPKVS